MFLFFSFSFFTASLNTYVFIFLKFFVYSTKHFSAFVKTVPDISAKLYLESGYYRLNHCIYSNHSTMTDC